MVKDGIADCCELPRKPPTEISRDDKIRPGRKLPLSKRVGGSCFAAKKSGTANISFRLLDESFFYLSDITFYY